MGAVSKGEPGNGSLFLPSPLGKSPVAVEGKGSGHQQMPHMHGAHGRNREGAGLQPLSADNWQAAETPQLAS